MLHTVQATVDVAQRALAEVHDLSVIRDKKHRALVSEARDELIRGDEKQALSFCLDALRIQCSYEALSLAGTLCAILGDLERSVGYTRKAIEISPDRADAYYDLATTLFDMGEPAEALPLLERGVELLGSRDDDLVDFLWSALIETLSELGFLEEAREALKEARTKTDDPLGLIEAAEEILETRCEKPSLRVL